MVATQTNRSQQEPIIVLILDDDSSVRMALARLLRTAGIISHTYPSVEDLLENIEKPQNTCVVADIRLPGISGLALPKLLAERGLKLPVIFVTAQDSEQSRAEAKRVGAAGYFNKPVDDHALLDTIEWVLRDSDYNPSSKEVI